MKKNILKTNLTLVFIILTNIIVAQKIYTGSLSLKSQAEVDAFGAENYTEIEGWLRVEGEDITNLDALQTLEKVKYSLWILNNPNLESINGLFNLKSVAISDISSNLYIKNNFKLKSLKGIQNLKYINFIKIIGNKSLKDIDSLKNINPKIRHINISENDSLLDLKGLQNIKEITGYLYLKENKNLQSLKGLDSLITIGGTLTLQENVSIENLNSLSKLENAGSLWITLNKKLNNFCGLANLFKSDLPGSFSMTAGGNLYNPKVNDIKNGDCSLKIQFTQIPDNNFEQALIDLGLDDVIDNRVQTSNINALTKLDVDGANLTNKITDLTGIQDFIALAELNCWNNKITSLDVSKNINLKDLYISNNLLNTIDVSKNNLLEVLYCGYNQFTGLDLSSNTKLKQLGCARNNLSSLDLSNNSELDYLVFSDNSLTNIDVSNLNLLEHLVFTNNQISEIDLSNNLNLTGLFVANNKLVDLDIGANKKIYRFNASSNNLATLNVKNTNNTNFITFDISNNPYLTCVFVDDAKYSNNNWTNIDLNAAFVENQAECEAQFTNIPDNNFEQGLIDLGLDNVVNNKVKTSNISTLTKLDLDGANKGTNTKIKDLTGIEDFVALTELNCWNNKITSLDVSKNINLKDLYISNNLLNTIDVSKNNLLEVLYCGYNKFTALDLSNNTKLKQLGCARNNLSSLDLSNNSDLGYLVFSDNSLTKIDVSNLNLLGHIVFTNNQISEIDLSNNLNLTGLFADNNQLKELDISRNRKIYRFSVSNNELTTLNVKNTNNTNFISFNATNNPNLSCIFVDDKSYSSNNWIKKDATSFFVETQLECETTLSNSKVFELATSIFPNPTKNNFTIQTEELISKVIIYDVLGKKLATFVNTKKVSLESVPNGIYFIHIFSDKLQQKVIKIIKN
ncbi:T9SS type A sorting domain-containing protein [uncultured Polaribacter sp.]|uniref:T9SS type A sorting domain-containing protein n=1 Tax=uncultured Polaribacter sp. TaxID=174711 RepID=UPI0026359FB4|nr:T9SS type A sorting domain-containing protein [uncultured Polaribacter sp.]